MRPLSPVQRQLVLRLFAHGKSLAAIANEAGVSLSSVARLTHGYGRRRKLQVNEDDPPPGFDRAKLKRCPGCGGLVYVWPCLTCKIRSRVRGG